MPPVRKAALSDLQEKKGKSEMAGLYGPVGKVSRRLGVGITAKGARILGKRPFPPGQHGNSGRPPKISDYGLQLREKQKLRAFYGLREKQFSRTFAEALRMHGPTGENLMSLLERRLDNVVYRQGLAQTRAQARQIVNHGHFTVNGRVVDVPSYRVRPGEVIAVADASKSKGYFKDLINSGTLAHIHPPDWFEAVKTPGESERLSWRITAFPRREHGEQEVNENIIVEFYSR